MVLLDKLQRWVAEPPPERLFEVGENALAAVSPRAPQQARQHALPEKWLVPAPNAPNVLRPDVFGEALTQVTQGGRAKQTNAALVIPDYAVRMAVLDFEEFPSGPDEQMALVRFRLRKSVPFLIDEAQVSYAVQRKELARTEVLAVAIARPILEEYENLLTAAGYRPGLVVPSSLACLPLCAPSQSGLTLLAKTAGLTLSVILLDRGEVRLVRCLDLTDDDYRPAGIPAVLTLFQQTVAFAEDQLGRQIERLLLCGFGGDLERLGQLAESELQIPYATLQSRFGTLSSENAGLFGLLESYR